MSRTCIAWLAAVVGMLAIAWGTRLSTREAAPAEPTEIAEWIAMLKDADPDVRERARSGLIRIGEPAIPLLTALLEGEDATGKHEAASVLLRIRSVAAVPALIHLVKTADPAVRREAIEALMCIGPPARAAVPVLIELVRSKQTHRIKKLGGYCFIPMALVRIQGADALPALMEMLADPELRLEAATALEYLGPASRAALPALERAAQDETPALRNHIRIAASHIRLRGTWVLMTSGDVAAHARVEWTIDGNRWSKGPPLGPKTHGILYFDSERRPDTVDMIIASHGSSERPLFRWEIAGDTLTICEVESDHGADPSVKSSSDRRPVCWKRLTP